jgi:crotonobetainyl-CoA:carnitine CoA-transferase CaiB-like acyl-CoA transferase
MTSISNYGQTGPYRDYKATEITLYAMGGSMYQTGEPYREPVKLGMTVEQFFCGTVAASATMGAFMGAALQGVGQHVDLSLHEIMTGNQDRALTNLTDYQHTGDLPVRHLESSSGFSPTLPVVDGYVQFYSIPRTWKRICEMIDHTELGDRPDLTNPTQPEAKETVVALLLEWLDGRKKQDVMELAQTHGIFCSAVNTTEDVFRDPHVAERGFLVEVDHPYTGPLRYPGPPFRMMETPWRAGRAPLLGEHTSEVLATLGYAADDVARLREQGAI